MSTIFPNVDFCFRRGTREGILNAPIKNGAFNFTMDSEELYVDIDNKRLNISGVEFYDTEAEIKSLSVVAPKLYIAYETRKILAYNFNTGTWFYIGGSKDTMTAEEVSYDNTESGLDGDNVQSGMDEIVRRTWTGTLAEYNAITTKDPDTTYYITDGGSQGISVFASNVAYDHTQSHLMANDVQAAIDELKATIASLQLRITELENK